MNGRRLNLGCGVKVLGGYENYDKYPIDARVKKLDLEHLPLPFDDNSIDEILLSHIVEHLNVNQTSFFAEIYRVLKHGGKLTVVFPIFANSYTHTRWRHCRTYFNGIYTKGTKGSSDVFHREANFKLIRFSKHRRMSLRGWLSREKDRFMSWLESIFYTEYEWEMKK